MRGRSASGMPMPLSSTERIVWPLSSPPQTRTRPPSGVYFSALSTRFDSARSSSVPSASTLPALGATSTRSCCRLRSATGRNASPHALGEHPDVHGTGLEDLPPRFELRQVEQIAHDRTQAPDVLVEIG